MGAGSVIVKKLLPSRRIIINFSLFDSSWYELGVRLILAACCRRPLRMLLPAVKQCRLLAISSLATVSPPRYLGRIAGYC